MAFPDSLLTQDEHVILHVRPYWTDLLMSEGIRFGTYLGLLIVLSVTDQWRTPWLWTAALVVLVMGIAAINLVFGAIRRVLHWSFTHYVVTNQRVILRQGVLARSNHSVPLTMIRGTDIKQGLVDRLVGLGDLWLHTAVQMKLGIIVLRGLHRPFEVQRTLHTLIQGSRDAQPGTTEQTS